MFARLILVGILMSSKINGEICERCGNHYGAPGNQQKHGYCDPCLAHKKQDGKLTVDFIMIVGKYFESANDFINVMKVCKKYEELVLMYKFNPIVVDELLIELFHNKQTLHIYSPNYVLNINAYRNRLTAELNHLKRMVAGGNDLSNKIVQIEKAKSSFSKKDVLYKTLVNEQKQLERGLIDVRRVKNKIQKIEELLRILPEDFYQIVLWPGCHLLPIH